MIGTDEIFFGNLTKVSGSSASRRKIIVNKSNIVHALVIK